MRVLLLVTMVLATAAAATGPADAAKRKKARGWQPAPVTKDCTRLNARFGYYGNPWCSKAEQEAFDRATSRSSR